MDTSCAPGSRQPQALTPAHVDALYRACLAQADTPLADWCYAVWFGAPGRPLVMKFSKTALRACRPQILYLVGQLRQLHTPGQLRLSVGDFRDAARADAPWSGLTEAHLHLYLLVANSVFADVVCFPDRSDAGRLVRPPDATLSPEDPRFAAWYPGWQARHPEFVSPAALI